MDFPRRYSRKFDATFAELDRLSAQVPLDAPWTATDAVQLDKMTVEDWLRAKVKNEMVRDVFRFITHDIYQAEPFQMSFLFFLFYIRSGDKLETLYGIKDAAQAFLVEEGLHGVAEKLAAELEAVITYNSPVRTSHKQRTG